tara:strand:- start:3349 stop:3840 length:492 start_codon:yes stop_codon:yes gene_type:complete
MIEDYDEINHFIYNKIEKYNEKFAEFKKNLDLQDEKIKKHCAKNIKKSIKKNPKKAAENLINLARNNDLTTETTEESQDEIKKIFKGGMVDDDDDNIRIEEIPEEKTILNNSYDSIYIGVIISIILYIFIFLILYFLDKKNLYNINIFKPLVFIADLIKIIFK